ncbi:hypothetical protein GLYMA_09G016500v4 [Glycine max]|nr:hypothetical protein GLYMA_09G016500v4 [Glycine max]KAH1041025.1 hypothetical protein GYH30_023737 [Glycine max]
MESQMDQSNHLIKHEEYHVSNYIKASFSISMIQFLMVRNQFLYMLDKDHLAPFSWLLEPCTTCRHAIIKFYFPLTFLLS